MTDVPARLTAALADRYRIERDEHGRPSVLGAGGMATVYLALDLKHHRKVAVKVLRPELAAALGAERFLREIEISASLHHPHILALYDSGEADGFLYYVMPFVEGESLRDRLDRDRQLPLDEALRIAREVADALSYAHGRGVVHRDIKPENILLESGHAVVADFGIARAISAAGGEQLTETGLVVGTPSYMSPEQAAGDRELDGRSDLYSLACVLFEMLAGQPPFTGPTVESVVRQHVTAPPPPVTQFRPAVPAAVADALARALAKTPADRFNPVAQFTAALGRPEGVPPAPTSFRPRALVTGLIIVILAGAAGLLMNRLARRSAALIVVRTSQVTRDPGLEVDPALSPDGAMVAYAAGPPTRMQIRVRQATGGRIISLTDNPAENHRWPRWSPDGSRIAYQTGRGIEVIPALGGQPRLVVRVSEDSAWVPGSGHLAGFAWSPDGRQLAYARGFLSEGVLIVPVDGGEPRRLVGVRDLHSLVWSPDGARLAGVSDNPDFIFGNAYTAGVLRQLTFFVILPLDGGQTRSVEGVGDFAKWSPAGDLIVYHAAEGLRVTSLRQPGTRLLVDKASEGAEPFYADFSPDGRTVYYVSLGADASSIRAVPASGGRSRVLVRFDDPERQHTRYGFATDGRTFYFTMGSHESDLWLMELEQR